MTNSAPRPAEIFGVPVIFDDNGLMRPYPFTKPRPCHGYVCGCTCDDCDARAGKSALPAPPAPAQPWEATA